MELPKYKLEDYTDSTAPFDFVLKQKTPLEQEQAIAALSKQAKDIDPSINFKRLFDAYMKGKKESGEQHVTEFTDQPVQLASGDWICDDYGVRRFENGRMVTACQHPIMPVSRLINIDTGYAKIEVAFRRPGKKWTVAVCDAETLASNRAITKLSQQDIQVTSSTAKGLVDYLSDLEQINYERLPEKRSTSHMGWAGDKAFVPYVSDIVPDNTEDGNRMYWNSVKCSTAERGEDIYMQAIRDIRAGKQIIPRIVLAASLSSVLVQPCGMLPFICHLWGKTGTGKTVALMLASSVWGDPDIGRYTRSCNATQVGLELLASMLNNLPLVLDELQTISSKRDFEDTMYELTEGTNRSRGTKTIGIQTMRKWSNCTITNGEQPITSSSSGGGVVNRILDLHCTKEPLFKDPVRLSAMLKKCYGYLGKRFVELLYHKDVMDEAKQLREAAYNDIMRYGKNIPEKQAQSASLILAADAIATKYIIKDKYILMPKDLVPFIADAEDIDAGRRAYDWVLNWISSQRMHFFNVTDDFSEVHTEVYGTINPDNTVTIINSVFKKACTDAGFNPTSFKQWLYEEDLSVHSIGRLDKSCRVGGTSIHCMVIKTAETIEFDPIDDGEQVEW